MKRHTKQNNQQANGQFFTTNADYILEGYEDIVKGKDIIDPFAGGKDLMNWSMKNGASSAQGYDITPLSDDIIYNDSLMTPPSYKGKLLVSNPPYLSRNKCKGSKEVFGKWGASDYYKCHLKSLVFNDAEEAILIIPANFLSEGRSKARDELFSHYYMVKAKIWNEPTFDDATVGVCLLHIKLGRRRSQAFPLTLMPANTTIDVDLLPENGYLYGNKFFDYIRNTDPIKIIKTDYGMDAPNTNIVVGLLDKGAKRCGLSFNHGDPIYNKPSAFTTYQITAPDYSWTIDEQKEIIQRFNEKFDGFRKEYHSLFLSNYMGVSQKIVARGFITKMISAIVKEMKIKLDKDVLW